jgi:hypothetical protein
MAENPSQDKVDKDVLYEVAYDEAARALSEQLSAIENLRGRAGFLLSAAAITTSVLSGQALASGGSSALLWLASPASLRLLPLRWPSSGRAFPSSQPIRPRSSSAT